MTLALHEVLCVFDSDARPLPRHAGPPLDEQPARPYRHVLSPGERNLLGCVPTRAAWTTRQIARAAGVTEAWARVQLAGLEAHHLVERTGGVGRGYARGREAQTWKRARGAFEVLT